MSARRTRAHIVAVVQALRGKPARSEHGLEFDCIECRRHILHVCGPSPMPGLCAMCLTMPEWFRDARLRALLDPEHDGSDPADEALAQR